VYLRILHGDAERLVVTVGLMQGFRNPRRQVAMATKFCTVEPNICQFLLRNLLNVKFLAFRILIWPSRFLENLCTSGLKFVYQINGSLKTLFHFSHTFFCCKHVIIIMWNTVLVSGAVKTLKLAKYTCPVIYSRNSAQRNDTTTDRWTTTCKVSLISGRRMFQ
jgi:hypothetical protein